MLFRSQTVASEIQSQPNSTIESRNTHQILIQLIPQEVASDIRAIQHRLARFEDQLDIMRDEITLITRRLRGISVETRQRGQHDN